MSVPFLDFRPQFVGLMVDDINFALPIIRDIPEFLCGLGIYDSIPENQIGQSKL